VSVILAWGPADDPPLGTVAGELSDRGHDVVLVDDDVLRELDYDVTVTPALQGWIQTPGRRIDLADLAGVFVRPGPSRSGRAAAASAALALACAETPAVVVNRPTAGRSNWSKPFQARLITNAGLGVPDTIVTTDPDVARRFVDEHARVVYKSVSGLRSIVAAIEAGDSALLDRLDAVRNGPVQLQRWIDGTDVRVHIVGDRCFATEIVSPSVDYRYAAVTGVPPSFTATTVPDPVRERCVAMTHEMGLLVSGIDLRVDPEGAWYCFEVNPAPGFTYYEEHTGQPIAAAVADLLSIAVASRV
jgi:glutathione synthase/RimK-type ligase-like ATP-grasp enzyme